jgi:hypothetical protein
MSIGGELNPTMKTIQRHFLTGLLVGAALFGQNASAQLSTPPATSAEMEATYTAAIESRTDDILKLLSVTNAATANIVHDLIIAQYRVMRARDELINAKLQAMGKAVNYTNRAEELEAQSKLLHDHFLAELGKMLKPADIEKIKDKMTYNKVQITYEAYNNIIPGLTETDKAKIMDLLIAAREKAMDGGNASEKSDIFQAYKDQINDYLNAHGHDVAKAYKDWEAKQALATAAATNTSTNVVQ